VHSVRFVTAAALFDGHDAAINIMRRILQSQGAEVIHLGHDRSAREVVDAVLQEDAHGVAISSCAGSCRRAPSPPDSAAPHHARRRTPCHGW
jgi:methylmalonyl-CoA mutase